MDLRLSDEQRLIQETARDFADKEIAPRARDNDRAARFDRELASMIGEMGYLGAPVAEEYGGRGLDYVTYGLIVEEVGRADSSARTVVSVQTSLVCGSIERWGSEEQKREWLPRLCSGEALGCFALTEPLPEWPASARVATVTYSPTEILTGVKSTSYAANMQATRIAEGQGADEAILVRPDGVVLEAPTSAVFWVSDGELRTPALGVGILDSITRDRILAALDIAEGDFQADDLRGAEQAFLASTTREIQPISAVDGRELPGAPTRAREAADALRAAVERELG